MDSTQSEWKPVHLVDDVAPEIAETAVAALPAARPDQVLRVVGQLHDAYAKLAEQGEVGDVVVDGRGVLPAEDDPDPVFLFRLSDVGGAVHLGQDIAMLGQILLPLRDIGHGVVEAFPDRAGTVGGGQPATMHLFEHVARPLRDHKAVDDDTFLVEGVRRGPGHV